MGVSNNVGGDTLKGVADTHKLHLCPEKCLHGDCIQCYLTLDNSLVLILTPLTSERFIPCVQRAHGLSPFIIHMVEHIETTYVTPRDRKRYDSSVVVTFREQRSEAPLPMHSLS